MVNSLLVTLPPVHNFLDNLVTQYLVSSPNTPNS